MTSYFAYWTNWWNDVDQQMRNLAGENELLRKEYEETVKCMTVLRDQNRALSLWRDDTMKQQKQLQARGRAKNDQIRELQKEVLRYKKTISSSNSCPTQLSDTTIQSKMDALFHAVRDWAVDSVRRDSALFDSMDEGVSEWLYHQIPRGKEGSSTHKVNALVVFVSKALVQSSNQNWVFGVAAEKSDSLIAMANRLNAKIESIPALAVEKKKQWVMLTNGLISKDEDSVEESLDVWTQVIVQKVEQYLGQEGRDLESPTIAGLRFAIRPHIHVIQALHHQEADYSIVLLTATKENFRRKFLPDRMDEVNGEEGGVVQASFFPIVYKDVVIDKKVERVVICKAKVMVGP
ncbi:hypothetical protein KCU81_g7581, partial [Aureobasidium melanogenum]|uniref:Uncharacterized protein n=1 Tax=Aureobasidium melanogenum (strain CBS 110374) TaxID=1043003 RepID=A0A074VDY1_AURM1